MNTDIVTALRRQLIETYEPLIDGSRPVAIIDFPMAINSGDHAIWLGEKALLRHLGIQPAYECAMETYNREAMAAALGDGTILMHGGGNFGDVYLYHRFRLKVLEEFPNNQVIIFPQTMMFYSTEMLKHTVAQIEKHGNVTVTARDALSFYNLQKYFGPKTKTLMAPDMAFMMGRLRRQNKPKFDILWLRRDDIESSVALPAEEIARLGAMEETTLKILPFPEGGALLSEAKYIGDTLCVTDWFNANFADRTRIPEFQKWDFDTKSRFWVTWAMHILSLGRVVITDRLHGHILCTLAGIPHILLNNNYGKNFNYYETWSKDVPICWVAPGPKRALEMAQEVLKRMPAEDAA